MCPEPIFRQGHRACAKNLVSGDETSCGLNHVVKFSEPPPSVSHAVNKRLGFDPQHWVALFFPFFFFNFCITVYGLSFLADDGKYVAALLFIYFLGLY